MWKVCQNSQNASEIAYFPYIFNGITVITYSESMWFWTLSLWHMETTVTELWIRGHRPWWLGCNIKPWSKWWMPCIRELKTKWMYFPSSLFCFSLLILPLILYFKRQPKLLRTILEDYYRATWRFVAGQTPRSVWRPWSGPITKNDDRIKSVWKRLQ